MLGALERPSLPLPVVARGSAVTSGVDGEMDQSQEGNGRCETLTGKERRGCASGEILCELAEIAKEDTLNVMAS